MYTIGEVSEKFGLPVSTLRYYDKQGLFPAMERKSGIRQFGEREVETIRIIECLKQSGLEIKDIKHYMDLCEQGASTYAQRKELFEKQRRCVEAEIERLNRVSDMLTFKCWFYEQAMAEGSDEAVRSLLPDRLPEDIQEIYDRAHT